MLYGANANVLPGAPSRASSNAAMVEKLVNPEVWTMYDTLILSPAGYNVGGSTAGLHFSGISQSTSFFNSRTIGSAGEAITSMTTASGYVDFPFKAFGCGVDVWGGLEASGTLSSVSVLTMSTTQTFVDAVVNGGALVLQFATDPKFIIPIADLPGGGGLNAVYAPYVGIGSAMAGGATNGLPSVQSRVLWKDYILFRGKDTPFTCSLKLNNVALARINNLPNLQNVATVPYSCGIRIKFWGYRGKSLITGSPYRGQ